MSRKLGCVPVCCCCALPKWGYSGSSSDTKMRKITSQTDNRKHVVKERERERERISWKKEKKKKNANNAEMKMQCIRVTEGKKSKRKRVAPMSNVSRLGRVHRKPLASWSRSLYNPAILKPSESTKAVPRNKVNHRRIKSAQGQTWYRVTQPPH